MNVQQLERQLAWSKKQTSFAWAKFYTAETNILRQDIITYHTIENLQGQLASSAQHGGRPTAIHHNLPEFIANEMREMMTTLKKKIDCPVCLEEINPENIGFSKCGHKYCKGCLEKIKSIGDKKCAICRRKLCK